MLWAVTPDSVGSRVGVRSIKPDWPLADGETFTTEDWQPGMVLAEDEASLRWPTDAEQAAAAEPELLAAIDSAASAARARFITEGVGQSAVYLTKYEEARAYKDASSPTDSDYPYLNAEAGRRNMTVGALADEVIATRNGWNDPAGATIEAERVGGKADVRAAESADDKRSACDDAIAALDGIEP